MDVDANFDVVFWPVAVDFKTKDVEAMEDKSITLCLFNGAIRTDDNEYMAKLLRQKSVVLVAFGSCAGEGCIPALSNSTTRQEDAGTSSTAVRRRRTIPRASGRRRAPRFNGFELELPEFWEDGFVRWTRWWTSTTTCRVVRPKGIRSGRCSRR